MRDGGGRGEGPGDLLHRREEILEHRARAEVDLGVDLRTRIDVLDPD